MKRLLTFEYQDGLYFIAEDGENVFSISEQNLRFDAFRFYEGLYAENKKSTFIELTDCTENTNKTGKYIFSWISEIITAIHDALPDGDDETKKNISEKEAKNYAPRKIIPLFTFAACAGDGFYTDENIPHEDYSTEIMEADFAVKISGQSMEPTIPDGTVVLVKKVEKLAHNEIGIFNVDGSTMCKRYIRRGRGEVLVPDNRCGKFDEIKVSSVSICTVQGRVINYQ